MLVRFPFTQCYLSKDVFVYKDRSTRFVPSPCFILIPESTFYTYSLFYTQSAVRGRQSTVHVSY